MKALETLFAYTVLALFIAMWVLFAAAYVSVLWLVVEEL